MEWPAAILVVLMLVAAGYAVWRNMSDGVGNNRIGTSNQGFGGDRGNDYRDNDLS